MTADIWTAPTGRRWASLTDDATGHGGFVSVRTTNLFVIVGQTDAFFLPSSCYHLIPGKVECKTGPCEAHFSSVSPEFSQSAGLGGNCCFLPQRRPSGSHVAPLLKFDSFYLTWPKSSDWSTLQCAETEVKFVPSANKSRGGGSFGPCVFGRPPGQQTDHLQHLSVCLRSLPVCFNH